MSNFKMNSLLWLLLLLAGYISCQDISIRCERFHDTDNFNVICNFTDQRNINPSCPSNSLLIPQFSKITVKCAIDSAFPFPAKCKIIDTRGQETVGKEILEAQATPFMSTVAHDETVIDGLLKFESIFSNALAIGEALIRCEGTKNQNRVRCSLFGLGDQASATANMSCSSTFNYISVEDSTTMVQCGFSEDHVSGKFRGNMSLILKSFNDGSGATIDVLFAANSPTQNIMETVRSGCHVLPTEDREGILVCDAYLNEGGFCEDPVCCKGKEEEKTSSVRDRVWELDRTVVFDIEGPSFGKVQFTCNVAEDAQGGLAKCFFHYVNGSTLIDTKAIGDLSFVDGAIVFNTFQLVLVNVMDETITNSISIDRCKMDLNDKSFICEVQLGKEQQVFARRQCKVQSTTTQDSITEYSLSCNVNLIEDYVFEGKVIDSREDPALIQITFDGQVRSANRPEVLQTTISCSVGSSLMLENPVNVKCKADFRQQ